MSAHPIRMTNSDDGARSRLTVFFRVLLAIPHVIWLELWGIAVLIAWIVSWFATLITGRTPDVLHRFIAAFERYRLHFSAFVLLIANPFPGFTGAENSYPVDLHIAPPQAQNRWKTLFRGVLAIPALLVCGVLAYVLYVVATLGWFAGLLTARMPSGLQRLGVYVLRYTAQTNAYLLLLTDRYPYSGPESDWIEATPTASGLVAQPSARAGPPAFRDE